MTTTYSDSGVNIEAGNAFVNRIKAFCPDVGGFGGLYPFGDQYLVAGTDGVGTKLKLAFAENRHETIGIDLVAMCVNDIITTGARPLFFLDYFATSRLDVDQAEAVVKGIVEGCRRAECVLLGGETAEMPGFYQEGEYDISGFAVGVVDKDKVIDGKTIVPGDCLVGLPSSGVHSNGYSLVRKILEKGGTPPVDLLEPTCIYVDEIKKLQNKVTLKGIAHITGGGLSENIPRIIPASYGVVIDRTAWEIPQVFKWLQREGSVPPHEMARTFNMGIGMVIAVSKEDAAKLDDISVIGYITEDEGVHWQ